MQVRRKFIQLLCLLGVAVILLTGCDFSTPSRAAPDNFVPQDMEYALGTQAAATVLAERMIEAGDGTPLELPTGTFTPPAVSIDSPTPLPETATPPQATAEPLLPTATPLPPTDTPLPPTLTPSATPLVELPPANMHCAVIGQKPENIFVTIPGMDFDLTWTVQNTGNDGWSKATVWAGFISGTKIHKYDNRMVIDHDVAPNETLEVFLDMRVPSEKGGYIDTWGLFYGDKAFCEFSLSVEITE